jgi:spermidine synthase
MIPPDGSNFKVLCEDGADFVQNRAELVDVLLVDGFDQDGQAKQLCSKTFYSDCYAKLRSGGVMAVNLLHSDVGFGTYTARIREAFDSQVVFVEAEEFGNNIAFAYKGKNFPPVNTISERARDLSQAHTVALHKIAQKVNKQLKQYSSSIGNCPT